MTVKVSINFSKVLSGISGNKLVKARRFIANELVTLTDPFVPYRDGFLKNSATIAIDGSFIKYDTPYARRLYFNPQYNFKGAPQRGGEWVERSWGINGKAIKEALVRYIESGV